SRLVPADDGGRVTDRDGIDLSSGRLAYCRQRGQPVVKISEPPIQRTCRLDVRALPFATLLGETKGISRLGVVGCRGPRSLACSHHGPRGRVLAARLGQLLLRFDPLDFVEAVLSRDPQLDLVQTIAKQVGLPSRRRA